MYLTEIIFPSCIFIAVLLVFTSTYPTSVPAPKPLQAKDPSILPIPDEERSPLPNSFESDIFLTPAQQIELDSKAIPSNDRNIIHSALTRKMISNTKFYWPNATVYFMVDNSIDLSVAQRLYSAIDEWQGKTCLRFRPVQDLSSDSSYVVFQGSDFGCGATLGRVGGKQVANLSTDCQVGSIVHEIGHIIGFIHEQSRPDRDFYVNILYRNIEPEKKDQFKKYSRNDIETRNVPYDIGSVMHYGSTAFSRDKSLRTIKTNDRLVQMWMGQRDGLSFLDAKLANIVYNCSGKCDQTLKCQNGGYIGPNCLCVCPRGLTGDRCQDTRISIKSWCGGTIYSNGGGFITSPNYPRDYPDAEDCYWLLKGPPGSRLEVNFDDFQTEADDNCAYDYLEVLVYGPDRVGRRYCGDSHTGEKFLFSGDSLLLHFKSDAKFGFRGFQITYSVIR